MLEVARTTSTREVPRDGTALGLSFQVLKPLLALADTALIIGASVVGGSTFHLASYGDSGDVGVWMGLGVVGSLGYALIARYLGLYNLQRFLEGRRDYEQVVGAWLTVVLLLAVLLFLLKLGDQVSRGSVVSYCGLAAVLLLAWRKTAKSLFNRAAAAGSLRGRRVILVGTLDELSAIGSEYLLHRYGVEDVDQVVLPQHGLTHEGGGYGLQIDELQKRIHMRGAQEIVLAMSWQDSKRLETICDQLKVLPLPVRMLPDRSMRTVLESHATPETTLLVDVQRAPLSVVELAAKRAFDCALAVFAIVTLAPLMLVTALAVRLDSAGPVIFRQRRNGFGGQEFFIYKFRTMHVLEDGAAILQARRGDPRVTRIGRLLRATSIDELPQLFNVLKGEMSIVGPRPHALAHDDQYSQLIDDYAVRSHVKPGMTGWAQVNGFRGETRRLEQMKKRVELDIWYINNWSIGLDLVVMLRTVLEITRPRNAY